MLVCCCHVCSAVVINPLTGEEPIPAVFSDGIGLYSLLILSYRQNCQQLKEKCWNQAVSANKKWEIIFDVRHKNSSSAVGIYALI